MNSKAKKQAIAKVWKLENYFFGLKVGEYADMSNGEYYWIRDHLMNIIGSLQNFDDVDETYDNTVEEELEA